MVTSVDLPSDNELEVSVFGPLRGFGESVLLHIGNGQWIIVDSCCSDNNGKPAPLIYLESIGVDVSTSVRLVIASHWHSDHIKGLDKIFQECKNAKFVCSSALRMEELLVLSQAYNRRALSLNKHGLEELHQILLTLVERSTKPGYKHFCSPVWAISQRSLMKYQVSEDDDIECAVSALSPSDASVLKAQQEISSLVDEYMDGPKRNIVGRNPNHNAIVLWVNIGHHHILLGSDLEETKNPNRGWTIILSEFDSRGDKADIYKVSHHGSFTGDNNGIWERLLGDNPHALLTSFVNGSTKLPKDEDIARIKLKTTNSYITSAPHLKHRKFSRNTKLLVHSATKSFHSCDNTIGHIRARIKISDSPGPSSWSIHLDKQSRRL